MDGNGRWAGRRHHNRVFGHIRGARVAKKIIEHAAKIGVPHLTLFTFSTENWSRPDDEVNFLMRLLVRQLNREIDALAKDNIRFRCIGQIACLPTFVQETIARVQEATKNNTGMNLVFAVSYGGRQEIRKAVEKLAALSASGSLRPEDITEDLISQTLESSFLPDPDLIIRTSGESRISNFFLWQAAYSEIYLCDKLWPDFNSTDLDSAIEYYCHRERRFGRTSQQITENDSQSSEEGRELSPCLV
ncbi:MAG: di-trans,poly-cis-decaprenylcistransferase [Pseudobdellovibrionaceae bacterium]|nr:MAG: di-trans,poly-cis-decaprenylcistransferase [Pseudobdellovibrionaceae bacterium]